MIRLRMMRRDLADLVERPKMLLISAVAVVMTLWSWFGGLGFGGVVVCFGDIFVGSGV